MFPQQAGLYYNPRLTSYHVLDSRFEVAQKRFGLVSLHLAVLDRFPPEEVVHLDSKDGRRAALILAAEITCITRNGTLYILILFVLSPKDTIVL